MSRNHKREKSASIELSEQDLKGIPLEIYNRRWKILAAMCASLLLVALGNSSMNMALPTVARELQLTTLQLTWIVDIYALVFASLLFTSSAVADHYGRKLVMQTGMAIVIAATAYAGLAADTGIKLIIARGVMGFGAAFVMPTTLSIIENVFPKKERPRAIAIWAGVAGGGIALGSILTGFLIENYSWQSVFYVSASLGIAGFVMNQILTPESRDERQTPVDWISGLLSVIGLLGLVYGIIEAPTEGLTDSIILTSLSVGLISLGAFVFRQLRIPHPMLDMKLFKNPAFSISALSVTLAFFALMGIFFSMSQLFQLVMGYGPMESSLRLLPIMLLMMLSAPLVPNVVRKIGTRAVVTTGLLLVSVAFVVMANWPVQPSYFQVLGSMFIMMTGMSLTMTPATNMMMSAIPRNRAGMGSAMNDTTRQLGGALGIAVLGSVLGSGYSDNIAAAIGQLPAQAQEIAGSSLAGALTIAQSMGDAGSELAAAAQSAWMAGMSDAMLIAAVIVVIAAIISGLWLPRRHKDEDDELLEPVIEG